MAKEFVMEWRSFLLMVLVCCNSALAAESAQRFQARGGNNGVLLIGIDSDIEIERIELALDGDDQNVRSIDIDHSEGWLVNLPSGHYTLEKLYMARGAYFDLSDLDGLGFQVSAGTINYFGHIRLIRGDVRSYIDLVNRASFAMEFLLRDHRSLLRRFAVKHSGPFEEGYFDHVLPLVGGQES